MTTRCTVFFALFLALAARANASPVTWQFQGFVSSNGIIPEIPDNSLMTVTWSFDSAEPNMCGPNAQTGTYAGQHVDFLVGSYLYSAVGFFQSGQPITLGCSTPPHVWGNELRLTLWTGPSFPTAVFLGSAAFFPGIFWGEDLNGALPKNPPAISMTDGPVFQTESGILALRTTLHPVPEPATLSLILAGFAGVWRARGRR